MKFSNKFYVITILLVSALFLVLLFGGAVILASEEGAPHWTYEGEEGPEHWGELSEEFELCGVGRAQSPIDITGATSVDLSDITFNYSAAPLAIFNNGHTIQVNYAPGSSITYNETTYELLQFHFHHPSEHTIDGAPAVMETHLVHRDAAGNLAVVGVLLYEGEAVNENYAVVFDNLPAEKGEPPESAELMVNAADLLPAGHLYTTYSGSLTTPPCSQGVRWLVMQEPVLVSAEQFEAFAAIFEMNARPVQPLNTRDLLEDSAG